MITYKDLCNALEKGIDTNNRIRVQLIKGAVKFRDELAKNLGLENKTYNVDGKDNEYVSLAPYINGEKSEGSFLDIPILKNEDIIYIEYLLCLILEKNERSFQKVSFNLPFKNYIENENLIIQVNDGGPQSDKTRFEIPVTLSGYSGIEAAFQAPVEEYKRMIMDEINSL